MIIESLLFFAGFILRLGSELDPLVQLDTSTEGFGGVRVFAMSNKIHVLGHACADPERQGHGAAPLKKLFLGNYGPDSLKNHEASKPEFNVGPSSARQQNARWQSDNCPLKVVFGFSIPYQLKKIIFSNLDPL